MFSAAVLRHLDSAGLVVFDRAGTDAFLETLPDKPVRATAAFTRPGGTGTSGGHGWDEPAVQLLIRDDGATGRARAGYERAKGIRDALHGLSSLLLAPGTPDEVWVVQILATTSEPVNLGDDKDDRPRWSVTFDAEVRNPTALRP